MAEAASSSSSPLAEAVPPPPPPPPSSPLEVSLPESRGNNGAEEPFVRPSASPEPNPPSNEEDIPPAPAPAPAPDPHSHRANRKPPLDDLARGISCVMGPVMNNFEVGVEGCLKSQSILASSIDRLTRELDKLLEDAPVPLVMQHATKLSSVRSRIASLSASLRIIQKRMESIDRLITGYDVRTKQAKVQQASHAPSAVLTELVYDGETADKDLHARLFPEDEEQDAKMSMEGSNIPNDQHSQDAKNEPSLESICIIDTNEEAIGDSEPDEASHVDTKNESSLEDICVDSNEEVRGYNAPDEASHVGKRMEPEQEKSEQAS